MKKKLFTLSIIAVLIIFMVVLASCGDNGGSTNTNTNTSSDVQEYTIQYTDNIGNHTITVKNGDVYSLESIPQKTGYTFKGLFDLEEGGTQYVSATGNSVSPFTDNKNVTLYPQFDAKEYTIILDYQGAEVTGTREIPVTYNSKINTLPTNLTVLNKNFTGWYTAPNKEGTQIADKYGVLPDKKLVTEKTFDITNEDGYIYLYAGFEYEKYTLTLYIGESSVPEEVSVEWGTHISSVQTETRVDGKAVLTWSKSKNDTALANVFNGKVEGDMILYSAEYAPVIDFNSMGGKEVNSIVNRAGNTISLPTPKRENYTFMGWYDTNGSKFEATAMPENSLTLNAKWQANIMLNENGGTDVQDITAPVGEPIELPTPERAGYIFAGWYDASGNKYESKAMPENSIVLTAKYYVIKKVNTSFLSANERECFRGKGTYFSVDLMKLDDSLEFSAPMKVNVKFTFTGYFNNSWGNSDTYATLGIYSKEEINDLYLLGKKYTYDFEGQTETITIYETVEINSKDLYVNFCMYPGYNAEGSITNVYVEIEYPDTSVLY